MTRLKALLILPCLAFVVQAQIDVDLVLEREFFLPAEPVEVGLRIANFTGDPLKLGAQRDWLQFSVESAKGNVVSKLAEPPESGEFTLQQSTRGTLRWNLTPMFSIDQPGTYRVVATVRLPSGEAYTTLPASFEVIAGVKLNEPREVGVKLPDGTTERRKFILQQVNFLAKVQLYLRITDVAESHTFAVIPLGSTVSFDRAQWVVDRETQFHVLHRATGSQYLYHVFLGDGSIVARQLWARSNEGRPELKVNDDGLVRVYNAVRISSPGDLPAAKGTNSVGATAEPAAAPVKPEVKPDAGPTPASKPPEAKPNDAKAPQ
jgi:hypothetical protein